MLNTNKIITHPLIPSREGNFLIPSREGIKGCVISSFISRFTLTAGLKKHSISSGILILICLIISSTESGAIPPRDRIYFKKPVAPASTIINENPYSTMKQIASFYFKDFQIDDEMYEITFGDSFLRFMPGSMLFVYDNGETQQVIQMSKPSFLLDDELMIPFVSICTKLEWLGLTKKPEEKKPPIADKSDKRKEKFNKIIQKFHPLKIEESDIEVIKNFKNLRIEKIEGMYSAVLDYDDDTENENEDEEPALEQLKKHAEPEIHKNEKQKQNVKSPQPPNQYIIPENLIRKEIKH
ncbi:MAG: hypothetical protein HW421_2195 [Ignavibacteria bacterium]|nr:hypothetical protein [Ignavibacteria bacterium]